MLGILHRDAPWVFGFHPKSYTLVHAWLKNRKPNEMGNNGLKYQRVDGAARAQARAEWNRPVRWPLFVACGLLVLLVAPAIFSYRRRERAAGR